MSDVRDSLVERINEDLRERVKGLALEGVDIIFVKDAFLQHRLSRVIVPGISKNITIMLLPDFEDFKALNEQEMKELGWVREEKK